MNFTTVKMDVAQKKPCSSPKIVKENFFGILKESFLLNKFYEKTILLKYNNIPIFCCTKNNCTPTYGEIVELMPRPAYGMKGEENLNS